jgi:hypothetical protein
MDCDFKLSRDSLNNVGILRPEELGAKFPDAFIQRQVKTLTNVV